MKIYWKKGKYNAEVRQVKSRIKTIEQKELKLARSLSVIDVEETTMKFLCMSLENLSLK